jgi:simple sugar transport system substrate-binding protein
MPRKILLMMLLILVAAIVAPVAAQDDEFVFGLVLVGPENDGGWSQAHYEGGLYVQEQIPGSRMVFRAALTPGDPVATLESVVSDMVADGAKLIITSSDAFEEDTARVAADPAFADVVFINVSGDDAYGGAGAPNVGNVMGQMEWGKMIAGCAAALTTETGSIGYLGPLINFETRRLAASAYLGARHCYETYAGGDPDALQFNVVWIGFWFYNPAFNTLDPTEVTNNFFDSGADVVLSGIDTTEAIVVADQRTTEAQSGSDPTTYYAVPYDFAGACDLGPAVCLGVPYFNWGPAYVNIVNAVKDGSWAPSWDWLGPDWSDINNHDTSAVGFIQGPALSDEDKASLDAFIAEMAAYAADPANENTFFLWEGPLSYQDGTVIAAEGEKLAAVAPAGEAPSVWYLDQLLEGMGGDSN